MLFWTELKLRRIRAQEREGFRVVLLWPNKTYVLHLMKLKQLVAIHELFVFSFVPREDDDVRL